MDGSYTITVNIVDSREKVAKEKITLNIDCTVFEEELNEFATAFEKDLEDIFEYEQEVKVLLPRIFKIVGTGELEIEFDTPVVPVPVEDIENDTIVIHTG